MLRPCIMLDANKCRGGYVSHPLHVGADERGITSPVFFERVREEDLGGTGWPAVSRARRPSVRPVSRTYSTKGSSIGQGTPGCDLTSDDCHRKSPFV